MSQKFLFPFNQFQKILYKDLYFLKMLKSNLTSIYYNFLKRKPFLPNFYIDKIINLYIIK